MPLYTSQELKSLSANNAATLRDQILLEGHKQHISFDIFLSHSFLDREEVKGIYHLLTNLGKRVYVDWIVDADLDRNNVTKAAAERIRNRMKMSRSLILAVSANAALSKWIPWELGFMDGRTNQCSIFPVSQNAIAPTAFQQSEYLKLYPYIKKVEATPLARDLYLVESSHRYVALQQWLNNAHQPIQQSVNIDML